MVHAGYNISVYENTTGNQEQDQQYNPDEEAGDDEPKAGLCCLGGCVTGCSLCLLLVIIFPAGILLSIYATNNKDYNVLAAGIILVAFPMVTIPVVIAIYLNRRRIRRIRKRKIADKNVPGNSGKY